MYKLVPTRRFIKQLKKLDRYTQILITKYLENNVLEDPRRHGKALVGNRGGQWRYRIGNYRVIVQIVDDEEYPKEKSILNVSQILKLKLVLNSIFS